MWATFSAPGAVFKIITAHDDDFYPTRDGLELGSYGSAANGEMRGSYLQSYNGANLAVTRIRETRWR